MYDNNKQGDITSISVVIFIVLAIIYLFGSCCMRYGNERQIVVTVTDKNVKTKGNDSKYLVYTKDEAGEIMVFEVSDAFFKGRFNSSDVYAGIEIGKTYKFTVIGSRVPLFSWYPNIINYQEVEDDQ